MWFFNSKKKIVKRIISLLKIQQEILLINLQQLVQTEKDFDQHEEWKRQYSFIGDVITNIQNEFKVN